MSETAPGIGDITSKSPDLPKAAELPNSESRSKKPRGPLRGLARAAIPLLGVGLAFGVSPAVDQRGLRPVTVSAAGETPTPTPSPTPDPLLAKVEAQKASTNAAATQAADAEKARKDQEANVAALNQAQIDYNTAQARIAAAQGPVLPPPERTAAAKATQAADLTRRINDQSTREAGFAVTATKEAVVAATATRIAQATATEETARAVGTATRTAAIVKEVERVKNAYSPGKFGKDAKNWSIPLLIAGAVGGGAIVKFRKNLTRKALWDRTKKFFNF